MVDAKRKLHEQDPSTHINARTPPTRIEVCFCRNWPNGALTRFITAAFPYWVDIFLPEIDVGIECFGSLAPEKHGMGATLNCALVASGCCMSLIE